MPQLPDRALPRPALVRCRRPPAAAAGRGGAGYSLVVLIMAIAVLNIMIAAALPKWSEMIKRDKEEELISRGWQYAEAIRLFQRRFQRYPVKFDELIKAQPRCIRQLWKDPMTDSGIWTPIFLNQGSPINVPGAQPPQAAQGLDPNKPQITTGPIIGVRSRSHQQSLLLFFGHDHYDEWEFRADLLAQANRVQFGGMAVNTGGFTLSTRWLGRPMPDFAQPGGMPLTNSMTPPGGQSGGTGGTAKPPGAGSGGTIRP